MKQHLLISIRITVALLVITCGAYPLAVWAVGQLAFPTRANGSLVLHDKKVVGSELIGQPFASDAFFHSRPSAAGTNGYDGMSSGGTNLGPTSKKLSDSVAAAVHDYRDVRPAEGIPADAVTASASGLDPHISPAWAHAQAPRVARARGIAVDEVERMIVARTESRFLGVFGDPRVNVLLLNRDLLLRGRS
jgi:K+-transporting ATPase ATPase C chain